MPVRLYFEPFRASFWDKEARLSVGWMFKDVIDVAGLALRQEAMCIMGEWKAFAAYAIECLERPSGAMPLYPDDAKWSRKARKKFCKRAGIEPVIGHLKSDHWMIRNYLNGTHGGAINTLMAAAAYSMRHWMKNNGFSSFVPWVKMLFGRLENVLLVNENKSACLRSTLAVVAWWGFSRLDYLNTNIIKDLYINFSEH